MKTESDLLQYISNIVDIPMGDAQKRYFQWRRDSAQVVEIYPTSVIMETYPEIKKVLSRYKPQPKRCFENAIKLSQRVCLNSDLELNYVEGLTNFCGIPIDHAWNEIDGLHFDITFDIALARFHKSKHYTPEESKEYVQIIKLPVEKASLYLL